MGSGGSEEVEEARGGALDGGELVWYHGSEERLQVDGQRGRCGGRRAVGVGVGTSGGCGLGGGEGGRRRRRREGGGEEREEVRREGGDVRGRERAGEAEGEKREEAGKRAGQGHRGFGEQVLSEITNVSKRQPKQTRHDASDERAWVR